jgi:hypothetical protein
MATMTTGTTPTRGAMSPIATCGVLYRLCARPRTAGRTSSSPIVYSTRAPALMLAMMTARRTR